MQRYNPGEIESKWQKIWSETKLYDVSQDQSKPKKYVAGMFPYPSGAGLHVGHVRNYSIVDVIARFHRQQGYNVLNPIGWDTFGLPAENYAIKTGTPPAVSTATNIKNFKNQFLRLGMSIDWSRELNTTDPEYYRWTQWIFTKLFERGLAYQAERAQWWCPFDKTVLANEQVEAGKCWRCGHAVEKKLMKQWFFKITEYADELLDGIDELDWPEGIKAMQRNWIGKSVGAEIDFGLDFGSAERNQSVDPDGKKSHLTVFTTRADTIFGATYLVVAPEHIWLTLALKHGGILGNTAEVQEYVDQAAKKSDLERQADQKDKTGVKLDGVMAVNPLTGDQIPIFVADYVLTGYGTGAIMAVPAHDERDYDFAKKFGLEIHNVVDPVTGEKQGDEVEKEAIVAVVHDPKTDKYLMLDWGPRMERWGGHLFIGGGVDDGEDLVDCAKREIAEETGYVNLEHRTTTDFTAHSYYFSNVKNKNYYARIKGLLFDLKDNSKQALNLDFGEQDKFKPVWVTAAQAEQLVDDDSHRYVFTSLVKGECFHGEGVLVNSGQYDGLSTSQARERIVADLAAKDLAKEKTNYRMNDWLISRQRYWGAPIPIIHCDKDGAVAVPESELPVILPAVDKYEPDGSGQGVLARAEDWVNVKCPKCGGEAKRETDTMDGYACSSWYYLRYTDPKNDRAAWDPAKANYWMPIDYYCGGDHAVSHLLYSRFWTKVFADMGLVEAREPVKKLVYNGYINAPDGFKMSKSKGNVVDPLELIDQGYGADALRLYELFIAPYELDAAWDPNGIAGTYRYLNRVWNLVQEYSASDRVSEAPLPAVHRAIKKVSSDLERLSFNTAIAAQMELVNQLYKAKTAGMRDQSWKFALASLVQLLAPFAPHMAEELWQQMGYTESVHTTAWPGWDESMLVEETVIVAVQINGKVKAELTLAKDSDQTTAETAALADDKVKTALAGRQPLRVVYVPGRILNLVVK
ncbi:MAG TPA: class I tRNA ligase family protein [Candidatus Saccharimonadales bacterium]|nr:class I tRNA ligase family protein [Candidatus Saccharimonadales bacterium]